MQDISFITKCDDVSLKYLTIFYELTKLGVVRFDLRNPEQLELFAQMVLLSMSYNPEKYADSPLLTQLQEQNRYMLYKLIVINLYKWAVF